MSRTGKGNNQGFTLAELMLSVVILSFGLVTIIGSFLVANRALNHSHNRLKAIEFLREKLFLLKVEALESGGLNPEEKSIKVALAGRPAVYKLEISPFTSVSDIDLSEELNLVKLSLGWKEANVGKELSVWTCLERKQQ
ncbi:MAG: type IV pilus modification PilV family protein [Candidatus Omnitrophota bacterium]